MTFAGWVATVAGWYVTEIGRQPYIVYGLIRAAEVASDVAAPMIRPRWCSMSRSTGAIVAYCGAESWPRA